MKRKPKIFGHIKICDRLVRCQLLHITPSGLRVVRLMETFRALREGEKFHVSRGEFIKDDLPLTA